MDGTVNSIDGVATNTTPLGFVARKMNNFSEFVIPNELYNKVRFGRDRNSRWNSFINIPELADNVKTSLYKDGRCYVTCEVTGATVCLRHDKKIKMTNESLEIIPDFLLYEAEEDFEGNEDYIDSYTFAAENLGFNEDQADFFAQCVLAFLDDFNSFYIENDSFDIELEVFVSNAIDEVRTVSEESGLDPHLELDIFQRLFEYISSNYDFHNIEG